MENGSVSDAQIAAARQAFAAVKRRDLAALLEHADPEIEIHPLTSVWRRAYHGHDGIEQWSRDVAELWAEFSIDAESIRELSEGTLLARLHWCGRARRGSIEVEGPAAAVLRFDGDKIAPVDVHLDEERASASVAR